MNSWGGFSTIDDPIQLDYLFGSNEDISPHELDPEMTSPRPNLEDIRALYKGWWEYINGYSYNRTNFWIWPDLCYVYVH